MTVVFKAPLLLLVIIIAAFVVAVLATLLKKSAPWRKILSLGLAIVICGGLLIWQYHDTHLVVDGLGIHADTYGKVNISWSDVEKTAVIQDLASSPYEPKLKTNGIGMGSYRAGWFKLANGSSAFVTLEIPNEALLIEAGTTSYLFGPKEFDAFVNAVASHVTVEK
jgi:hypothetical protein